MDMHGCVSLSLCIYAYISQDLYIYIYIHTHTYICGIHWVSPPYGDSDRKLLLQVFQGPSMFCLRDYYSKGD